MSQERHYTPQVGSRIRLRLFEDYTSLGLPAWSVLHVVSYYGDNVICIRSMTVNGERDGELVTVKLASIDPPIGWKSRYTIHVAPDKVSDVLSWLSRGIVVRQSQYIGDGSTVYQPADNSGQPHWKFTETTDTLTAEETKDFIQIVSVESVYDASIPAPCRYCNGTGIHTTNPALVAQTSAKQNCARCGLHTGFSFDEPYHDTSEQGCAHVRKAGECWVCGGSGHGAKYLSEMEPKRERKQAIAQLNKDGWKIWYQRAGSMWRMERETVVKDFGQEITA